MSILNNSIVPASAGGYEIDNSLRFNDDDSAYLSRTPSSAGNRKTWTWSGWVKRGELGDFNYFFEGQGSSTGDQFWFGTGDDLSLYGEGNAFEMYSTAKFRDPSAWYHIVIASDTTQATAADRIKAYVNGEQITDWSTASYVAQNRDGNVNNNTTQYLGKWAGGSTRHLDGYLAEVNFIDGYPTGVTQANWASTNIASNFGETGDYGEWKPIEYTGTYGTNGFHLDFGNSELGVDVSSDDTFGDGSLIYKLEMEDATATVGTDPAVRGTPTYVPGKYGNGLNCNNDHNTHFYDTSVIPQVGNVFSVSFWGKVTNPWGGFLQLGNDRYSSTLNVNGGDADGTVIVQGGSAGTLASTSNINANTQINHYVLIRDSGTKLYANGVLEIDLSHNTAVAGTDFYIGSGSANASNTITDSKFDGVLDHFEVYNRALTPDEVLSLYEGVHLGEDGSLNKNHWTPHNLSASDQMLDSPTNNFATLNPLATAHNGLSEGNLRIIPTYNVGFESTHGNVNFPSTGKWYVEVHVNSTLVSGATGAAFGVINGHKNNPAGHTVNYVGIYNSPDWNHYYYDDGGSTATKSGTFNLTNSSIVQIAFDSDNGQVWIGVDDSYIGFSGTTATVGTGDPSTNSNGTPLQSNPEEYVLMVLSSFQTTLGYPTVNFGQDSSFAGNKTAQSNTDDNGYGDFYYSPPTGYLALCTQNLDDPAVTPSEHFNTMLWTAQSASSTLTDNGDNTWTVNLDGITDGVDLSWIKCRSVAHNHVLFDGVRGWGAGYGLQPNGSWDERDTDGDVLSTSGSTVVLDEGNSVNGTYQAGQTYVGWFWKANGSDVLNENGTIDSQVSANQDAGFSIVSWVGSDGADSVGHGLSKAPELLILKNRSRSSSWRVHDNIPGKTNGRMDLENTSAENTSNHQITFQSSTWTFNSDSGAHEDWNQLNENIIAYCFHSVDGYSKVGSYTGNGSTDGTFVYTGFRPAWVMVKRTDASNDWGVMDTDRTQANHQNFKLLQPNNNTVEDTGADYVDMLSNGFKTRATSLFINASGGDYIYLAFAEHPFKYTNAR